MSDSLDTSTEDGASQPAAPPRRTSRRFFFFGIVALVIVLVAVVLAVTGSNSSSNSGSTTATTVPTDVVTPATILNDVTNIPSSVYDAVGVTSPKFKVTAPAHVPGQPLLTYPGVDGKQLPGVLYMGAEYSPFSAVQRWGLVAALSRFGTWHDLQLTRSSYADFFGGTSTFSFLKSSLASQYVAFRGYELYGNKISGKNFNKLQAPASSDTALYVHYINGKVVPNALPNAIPFTNFGNAFFYPGASFMPIDLKKLTWSTIAGNLNNPSEPTTQAIVASANYMSAAICHITGGRPGSVCDSAGVKAANAAMGI